MKQNEVTKEMEPVAMAVIETPDTAAEAGTTVERPADGEGCEGVTVIIVETLPEHPERASLAARSVRRNLMGVDAQLYILRYGEPSTVAQRLLQLLEAAPTERLVLMTDEMMILNPVLLGDVACVKAAKVGQAYSYNARIPVMMHRSALKALLESLLQQQLPYTDIVDAYFRGTLPDGYRPVMLGDWKTDPWLLPVVSRDPDTAALARYAQWKKFMHVGSASWSAGLLAFLEARFPL